MNVRYSQTKPQKNHLRNQFVKANTVVLAICLLIMASEIAIMALARRSYETAIKVEAKIEKILYSIPVQAVFLTATTLLSIFQLILTNEKCGKSCYCQISVNVE